MQRSGTKETKRSDTRISQSTSSDSNIRVETKEQHPGTPTSKLRSPGRIRSPKTLKVFQGDLDKRTYLSLVKQHVLQIDTETDGLEFRDKKLRLVQIGTKDRRVYMVHHPSPESYYLAAVLTHEFPAKYFHHALFDLRFIKFWLGVEVRKEIYCTKTMMKIIHPELRSGLVNSIREVLGIDIQQAKMIHGQWKNDKLTEKQKAYAAEDVLYLHSLAQQLKKDAAWGESARCDNAMQIIRTMVSNQVEGYEDIFDYAEDPDAIQNRKRWLIQWDSFPNQIKALAKGRIC